MSFCARIKFVTQEDSSFVLTKIKPPQILLIGMEALCGFCWKGKRGLYFLESVLVLREHCACSLPAEHWCFLPWPALLEACKHSYHFPKVGFSVFILIFFVVVFSLFPSSGVQRNRKNTECLMSLMTESKPSFLLCSTAVISMAI